MAAKQRCDDCVTVVFKNATMDWIQQVICACDADVTAIYRTNLLDENDKLKKEVAALREALNVKVRQLASGVVEGAK